MRIFPVLAAFALVACPKEEDTAGEPCLFYADLDVDGFGDASAPVQGRCAVPPAGTSKDEGDCDDADPTVNPAAAESCDGKDQDCDGIADDGVMSTWSGFRDVDGDGFGSEPVTVEACDGPEDLVTDGGDCDEGDALVHPGASEVCNDDDDDCDGLVDDADPDVVGQPTWFSDADGDGWGHSGTEARACVAPSGTVATDGDCDDTDPAFHPGAPETDCTDPADYDCDGFVVWADADGDGAAACVDCDEGDPAALPGATETCDGIDDDCDGLVDDADPDVVGQPTWYTDADGDGWGLAGTEARACVAPSGTVATDGDCDDTDPAFHPGAPETDCTDPADYDCDGFVVWADADGDGAAACVDCDEGDAQVHPGASEVCNDDDDDCDGLVDDDDPDVTGTATFYADDDGDGFGDVTGSTAACTAPTGFVVDGTDCDDAEAGNNPAAEEVCGDGIDQDCSGADTACTSVLTADSTWIAIRGTTAGEQLGNATWWNDAVADAGDLDLDGSDDIAIIAAGYEAPTAGCPSDGYTYTDEMMLYFFRGPVTASLTTADAASGFSSGEITGPYLEDGSPGGARQVSPAGDLTGDGAADLLYLEWSGSYAGGTGAGWAFIASELNFTSPCMGSGICDPCDAFGTSLAIHTDSNDWWSGELGTSADMTGDGLVDVTYYDFTWTSGSYDSGTFFFYAPITTDLEPEDADAAVMGTGADYYWTSATPIGDTNGDGLEDLAAWRLVDPSGAYTLEVGILEGPFSGYSLVTDATFFVRQGPESSYFNQDVPRLDDVDGDGLPDLAINQYLFSLPLSSDLTTADATATFEVPYVRTVGDMTGDGTADVWTPDPHDDTNGTDAGIACFYGGPVSGYLSHEDADVVLLGETAGDHFGTSVESAGDMDGDGLPDALIAAPYSDQGAADGGGVFLIGESFMP